MPARVPMYIHDLPASIAATTASQEPIAERIDLIVLMASRLSVLSAAAPPEGGELRQAASSLPPAVQAAVDARLRGDVFDAQQERAARDAGWHQLPSLQEDGKTRP